MTTRKLGSSGGSQECTSRDPANRWRGIRREVPPLRGLKKEAAHQWDADIVRSHFFTGGCFFQLR